MLIIFLLYLSCIQVLEVKCQAKQMLIGLWNQCDLIYKSGPIGFRSRPGKRVGFPFLFFIIAVYDCACECGDMSPGFLEVCN